MSLSFVCDVTPSARFINTEDGIRVTGSNLEEDEFYVLLPIAVEC